MIRNNDWHEGSKKKQTERKMLKPHLVSIKKQTEKRQSAVEEIFKDVDIDNDVVYTEEYS